MGFGYFGLMLILQIYNSYGVSSSLFSLCRSDIFVENDNQQEPELRRSSIVVAHKTEMTHTI